MKCEIEIAKDYHLCINNLDEILEVAYKYSPNAYDISDNVLTDNHFNSQRHRNVFDRFDLANLPKKWL